MIGEYFLDICMSACCSIDNTRKNYKEIFENIHKIFSKYRESLPKTSSTDFADKIEFIYYFSGIRYKRPDLTFEQICNAMQSGKLGKYLPILETKRMEMSNTDIENIFSTVVEKKKLIDLLSGKDTIIKLLNDIDIGNYTNETDIIDYWETAVTNLYKNIMDSKNSESLEKVSSLDLESDALDSVIERIHQNVNTDKTIKSGFRYITENCMAKGYERGRYYLVGGCSGVGKSTFLVGEIRSALEGAGRNCDEKRVYLYITAENLIDETWCRFYCCLTGKPYDTLLKEINNRFKELEDEGLDKESPEYMKTISSISRQYKEEVNKILVDRNCNVIFKYVQPGRTTVSDVEAILKETKEQYGDTFEAVYIDYLDLFSTGMNLDLRLELGVVSRQFKLFSVIFNIAVISATQLNREGYDPKIPAKLTQMGESMKKVDEADLILFLQLADEAQDLNVGDEVITKIRMTILKNRSGSTAPTSYAKITKKVNGVSAFNYRIEEMTRISNIEDDYTDEYGDSSSFSSTDTFGFGLYS
jgi:replicative DNA helicase